LGYSSGIRVQKPVGGAACNGVTAPLADENGPDGTKCLECISRCEVAAWIAAATLAMRDVGNRRCNIDDGTAPGASAETPATPNDGARYAPAHGAAANAQRAG